MNSASRTGMVVLLQVISVVAYADNRIRPQVTGSIFSYPNQPLVIIGPVGSEIQSVHASSYDSRGILEFIIPSLPGHVAQATLVLRESRGVSGVPMPPITHLVSTYEGDLLLDVADYDRAASPLVTFQSDSNDSTSYIRLDITPAVQAYEGRVLGLRIEVIDGGLNDGDAFFGGDSAGKNVPTIEVRRGHGTSN